MRCDIRQDLMADVSGEEITVGDTSGSFDDG